MKRLILFILILINVNIIVAQNVCNVVITSSFESKCVLTTDKDNLIDELPNEILACKESIVTYTANVNGGASNIQSLTWTVIGANSYTVNNDNTVTVHWGINNTGQVTAQVITNEGYTCTATKNVVLIEKPVIGSTTNPPYEYEGGGKVIKVCVGTDVEFTDASSTANSDISGYYWDSPYGTVSTKDYTIENIQQGVKVIHRIYNNCGCYDEEEYKIEVIEGEQLKLSCYGTVCEGATVTYTALNTNCNQYNWFVNGGHIILGQGTPTITVLWDNPQEGYGIIGIDGSACGGSYCPNMMSVKIPIITSNVDISGQSTACIGEAVIYSVPLYGSTEYNWTVTPLSGVSTSAYNGANQILLNFTTAGTYQLSVTYRCDFLDCGWFTSQTKTIVVKPKLAISGKDKICLSNAASLTLTPSVIATWRVYNVATNTQVYTTTGATLNYTFSTAGKYRVTAENSNYCNIAEFLIEILNPPPAPTVTDINNNIPSVSCPHSAIELSGIPSNHNYSLVWEPACTTAYPQMATGGDVTINYQNDVCNIYVYNYDKQLGCKSINHYTHVVNMFQLADITIPRNITACPGTIINWVNNQVPLQENVLYKWDIDPLKQNCATIVGNNNLSNNVQILVNQLTSIAYPYSFDIYLTRTYCTDSIKIDTITITIPNIDRYNLAILTNINSLCFGDNTSVQLTETGAPSTNGLSWIIDGDNNDHNGIISFGHTFTEVGNYNVIVQYNPYNYCNNNAYIASASTTIVVHPLPNIQSIIYNSVGGTNPIISVYPIPSTTSGYTYSWTLNGISIAGNSSSISFAGDGTYCCTVTNNYGCTKTICGEVNSSETPCEDINITLESNYLCKGDVTLKANNYGNYNVQWIVADNNGRATMTTSGSNNETTNIHFNDVGVYNVTAYAGGAGNCYSGSYTVTICCLLDISVEKACDKVIIKNNSKILNNNGTIYYTVNGTSSSNYHFSTNSSDINYPISSSGTYTFDFSYSGCGYTCYDNGNSVTFNTIPSNIQITTSNTANQTTTCDNTPITLTANYYTASGTIVPSIINSILWDFGDNSTATSSGNSISHTFAATMTYPVTATITDVNGCNNHTVSTQITSYSNNLNNGKLLTVGYPTCPGIQRRLNYSIPSLYNYNWFAPAHSIDNPASYKGEVFNTGDYKVIATNNNYCKNEAMVNVAFLNKPTATIYASKNTYCKNDEVELFGDNGVTDGTLSYSWEVKDNNGVAVSVSPSATDANINFTATQVGQYTAKLSVSYAGTVCSDNTTMNINVNDTPPAPSIGFGSNRCINDPPVNLITTSSSVQSDVYWNTGVYANSADYYNAGIATAYYYDIASGCKSNMAQLNIIPAPNFDGLLTGCYQKCFDHSHPFPTSITGYGISIHPVSWQWYYNNNLFANSTSTSVYNPLTLPLSSFGDYYLDINYFNNACSAKSSLLTIEQKDQCPCEDVVVEYTYKQPIVQDCKIIYHITITVCNNGTTTDCFNNLSSILDGNGIEILTVNNPNPVVNSGNCTTIDIIFKLNNPLLTHIPFVLYDNCNNCYKEFSIATKLQVYDCQEQMDLNNIEVLPDLSSSYIAYIKLLFNMISPTSTVFSFWSEPSQVVNYSYDNVSTITELNMFDIATLTQMAVREEKVCFYAIVCEEGDVICKKTFCIPAEELLAKINETININKHNNEINNSSNRPYLVPNPATTEVRVEGLNEDINELLLKSFCYFLHLKKTHQFNVFKLTI
jgi:hypothetical protein